VIKILALVMVMALFGCKSLPNEVALAGPPPERPELEVVVADGGFLIDRANMDLLLNWVIEIEGWVAKITGKK
jgi:hypothetical protein